MGLSVSKRGLLVVFAVAALLVIASTAAGQCSMCRTALTGSNNAFIRNFNIGVLVLLVPPVTIFCSLFVALKRYKNESGVASRDSGVKPTGSDFDPGV